MPAITATVKDISGRPDDSHWTFSSDLREQDGVIITPRVVRVKPFNGELALTLPPGPVRVTHHQDRWLIDVPEEDSDLWGLIEAATD
ncbi:hypothetical protein SEA_RHYNN_7 [Mycobacterium phage Rhynn]|nr:hypothetical protein SEA_RHYNN_7 [Mycobacterium phage Rhynn]